MRAVVEVKLRQNLAELERLIAELEEETQHHRSARELREAAVRRYPTCPCPDAACTGGAHR